MLEGIIFFKCLTPDKASSQICSMSLQIVFLGKHFEISHNVEVNYINKKLLKLAFSVWEAEVSPA